MLDYNKLNEALENVISSFDEEKIILDEKIMSKRKARRLRRKRRAEARKAAEQEQQTQEFDLDALDQAVKQNQSTEKPTEENSAEETENQEEQETKYELVVYQEPDPNDTNEEEEDDYSNVSEDFKQLVEALQKAETEYAKTTADALAKWKSAGVGAPCPEDAWNTLKSALETLQSTVEGLLGNFDFEKLAEPELALLNRMLEPLNGYMEKAMKMIDSAKPNLELNGDKPLEIEDKQSKALTVTTNDYHTETTPTVADDKDKKERKVVTYDSFYKSFGPLSSGMDELAKSLGKLIGATAKTLLQLASYPASFIADKLFGFLTSPLAKDFVKTIMYANPLTAMIFDGKFGDFGLTGILNNLHSAVKKGIDKGKNINKGDKKEPQYDELHLPVNTKDMNLKQMKRALYNNKEWCSCINHGYNHPRVETNNKAYLRKYVEGFNQALTDKNAKNAHINLDNLIKTTKEVCAEADWHKPSDWMVKDEFAAKHGNEKGEHGTTDAEENKITDLKDKLKAHTGDEEKANYLVDTIKTLKQLDTKNDAITAYLTSDKSKYKFADGDITKAIEEYDKATTNESFIAKTNRELQTLIEEWKIQ